MLKICGIFKSSVSGEFKKQVCAGMDDFRVDNLSFVWQCHKRIQHSMPPNRQYSIFPCSRLVNHLSDDSYSDLYDSCYEQFQRF